MVLKRRIQSGFIGYDAKNIPRARRSVRKRILCKKTIGDDQLCAFELLAAVAGKLLQESETSSASSSAAVAVDNHNIGKEVIKKAPRNRIDKATRPEQEEPGSSEESGVSSALGLQKCTQKDFCKEARDVSCEVNVKQIAQVSTSSCFVKGSSDAKPIAHSSIDKFKKLSSEEGGASPNCRESSNTIVYNEIARCHKVNGAMSEVLGVVEKFSSKDCVVSCGNLSSPVHSGYKANLAPRRGSTPDSVNAKYKNDMNIDSRDDDEILSQLSGHRSQGKVHQSPTNVEDCRISKLLTSKYWNSAPKLKDYKPINSGGSKRRKIYPDGISCYDREMLQHSTPFKKRKLFGQSSVVTYDGGISGESASNSNEKEVHNSNNSPTKSCAGNKMSLSSMDRQRSFNSRNSPVKLSINSLMVPELLVEIPESSTVASLKKTVMDAITTVLGGGLRVGMLLNGKKIRDDSRTLLQSGISENDNLDDLDFILEPSSSKQISSKHPHENPLVMPACPLPKYYINRPLIPKQELPPLEISDKTAVTDSSRVFQDLVPFSTPELENNPASDCKALVVVPENAEVLDVVPMSSKPRRSEIGQRRIRRPFSVTEVEALVQAVEKLGTGRWRDVKLAAFENAKHRTYVDLKDKWKTLVHTAKIAPQQRRGEPVPQALLDRVLAAHAHWCQHQAKQKQVHSDESGMLKLSDPLAQKVAA